MNDLKKLSDNGPVKRDKSDIIINLSALWFLIIYPLWSKVYVTIAFLIFRPTQGFSAIGTFMAPMLLPVLLLVLAFFAIIAYGIYKRNRTARIIALIYLTTNTLYNLYIFFLIFSGKSNLEISTTNLLQFLSSKSILLNIISMFLSTLVIYFLLFNKSVSSKFIKK